MKFNYIVCESDESIKQILKNKFTMSERYILKLKKNNCICINNIPVHINYKINPGDSLSITENFDEDSSNIVPNPNVSLDVLYEDEFGTAENPDDFSGTITLGDGEYYVLGDNRSGSTDSRWFGPVRFDQIKRKFVAKLF